jgi:hypothetical protein
MPITFTIDEDAPVLVELTPRRGIEDVSLSAADLAEKSAQALDNAMGTIRHMAQRVTTTIDGLARRPSNIEVEFGLKLDTEGFALITKVGIEATLNVKLTWEGKPQAGHEQPAG